MLEGTLINLSHIEEERDDQEYEEVMDAEDNLIFYFFLIEGL